MAFKISVTVTYGDNVSATIDADSQKELFEALAQAAEILSHAHCPRCKADTGKHALRQPGKYTYYEMQCSRCGWRLPYGQYNAPRNDELFAKREGWQPPYEKQENGESF